MNSKEELMRVIVFYVQQELGLLLLVQIIHQPVLNVSQVPIQKYLERIMKQHVNNVHQEHTLPHQAQILHHYVYVAHQELILKHGEQQTLITVNYVLKVPIPQ